MWMNDEFITIIRGFRGVIKVCYQNTVKLQHAHDLHLFISNNNNNMLYLYSALFS